MILYNTLHYHHIHRGIQLNELKALISILLWKGILWKSLFTHVSEFRYRDIMQISWNFRANSQILVAVFKAPDKKTQANFYISYKNDISTSYIHKMSSIQLRPHNEKSFWNYTLKLALLRLLSNHRQRMSVFRSDSYHLQPKNRQIWSAKTFFF